MVSGWGKIKFLGPVNVRNAMMNRILKVISGGRLGGQGSNDNGGDKFAKAHAEFVAKAKTEHGYTPVRHFDGGWAHPTWAAAVRNEAARKRAGWRYGHAA